MADCEAQFRRVLKARADNIEWRSALDWPTDFVARNARAADLIITGNQTARPDATRQINPGDLVLRAGRPVLVVPPGAEFLRLNRVVIAWKDTREARRAVNDALPLLHKAREVIGAMPDEAADKRQLRRLVSRMWPAGWFGAKSALRRSRQRLWSV
jgi:hypothetical protein